MDGFPTHQPKQSPQGSASSQAEDFKAFRRAVAGLDFSALGDPTPSEIPPDAIGGFELVRALGSGGQGVVYEAIEHATRRRVAIKVLRFGPLAKPQDRFRFDREIQALSQLRHPNVVALHGAGVIDRCGYLVMDYIDGRPIDEYVSSNRLTVRATLSLFEGVCNAVHAAHLKGIMHRDIKPRNILVESAGTPYVVDFGLARLQQESRELSDDSSNLDTRTGQIIGTPVWASPEQTEGNSTRVDIRTDVYSLGVVLYYVLTGAMPYDTSGPLSGIYERIRHTSPESPAGIRREIDNDLEAVLLKSLAKEPDRRYQSAGDLALDIGRYLAGDGVEAKRDSTAYVVCKYFKRHWLPTSLAAALAVVFMIGVPALVVLWRQATNDASSARQATEALVWYVHKLQPYYHPGESPTSLRPSLDVVARDVDTRFVDQPAIASELRLILAHAYSALESWNEANAQMSAALRAAKEAFGPNDVKIADILNAWGGIQIEQGDDRAARASHSEALGLLRALPNGDRPRESQTLFGLAYCSLVRGETKPAQVFLAESLRLTDDISPVGGAMARKVFAERLSDNLGLKAEADILQGDALALVRRFGTEEQIAHHLHSYGVLLRSMHQLTEAEALQRECLEIRERIYPRGHRFHFYVYVTMQSLGDTLRRQGEFAEAEQLLLQAQEGYQPGPDRYLLGISAEVLERIVALYEAWDAAEPGMGYDEDAEAWRTRLLELPNTLPIRPQAEFPHSGE